MVQKKDRLWRICSDYCRLNAINVPNKFPVPYLHDCSSNLRGKVIFFKLDLHQVYNQIPVASEIVPKTAIITPFGLFKYKFMTCGLRNTSQIFQRQIFRALGDLELVFAFIDNILIASLKEHKTYLRIVLAIKRISLTPQYRKVRVRQARIRILRLMINSGGAHFNASCASTAVCPDFRSWNLIQVTGEKAKCNRGKA